MFTSIRPLQYLWGVLTADRSPRQIAWGIALGMLVGMVPKGNLTAWLFAFMLFATRVNLGAGMLTAMAITIVNPAIDPLTHALGLRLLSFDLVRSCLSRWHETPFVPWLRLNNTVVLGSTTLGLILLYPVQHVAQCVVSAATKRYLDFRARNVEVDAAGEQAGADLPATVKAALEQVASSQSNLR